MNLPDKCPFCGAGIVVMENGEKCVSENWVAFQCITSIHAGQDIRRTQSRGCETNERIRLNARVTELEARCRRLEEALENVINAGKPNQREHPSMWKAWMKARLIMESKETKP